MMINRFLVATLKRFMPITAMKLNDKVLKKVLRWGLHLLGYQHL